MDNSGGPFEGMMDLGQIVIADKLPAAPSTELYTVHKEPGRM